MNRIVVISGKWCTGKTKMANQLSEILGWPVFSLDYYKEKRFDKGEGVEINDVSYDELFNDLIDTLDKNQSSIIESDFIDDKQVQRLSKISKDATVALVQIHLHSDKTTLIKRFIHRIESGERHPGHQDDQYLEKAKAELLSNSKDLKESPPLNLEGSLIKIDTSDFNKIDYSSIADQINSSTNK